MRQAIIRYLETELLDRRAAKISADEPLLTSGMLDSLGVMMLVQFIEDETAAEVPPEDVTLENFETVAAIDAYLSARGVRPVEGSPAAPVRGDP